MNQCKKCAQCCNITAQISKKEVKAIRDYLKKNPKILTQVNAETVRRREALLANKEASIRCFFRDPLTLKCLIYEIRPMICRSYKCWVSRDGTDKETLRLKKNKYLIADVLDFPRDLLARILYKIECEKRGVEYKDFIF